MNINSKAFAKPKLTKRQRKAARGDNFMVQECKRLGKKVGDYIGAVPQFADLNANKAGSPPHWVKVRAGITFVRQHAKLS